MTQAELIKMTQVRINKIPRSVAKYQEVQFESQCKIARVLPFEFNGRFHDWKKGDLFLVRPNSPLHQFKRNMTIYKSEKMISLHMSEVKQFIEMKRNKTYRFTGFFYEYDFETYYAKITDVKEK